MKLIKLLALIALMAFSASISAGNFTVGDKTFLLNGKPFIVKAAEVHYPRIPRPYWEHRIKMCKALEGYKDELKPVFKSTPTQFQTIIFATSDTQNVVG